MSVSVITNSEVQAYKDCPMYWWFKYVQMMELIQEPDPESAASFGTIGHLGAAAAWAAKSYGASSYSEFYQAAEKAVRDAGDDGSVADVLRITIRGQLKELMTHEVVGIEVPFKIKLKSGLWFAGKMDLITRHMGQLVVWDHKFSSSVDVFSRRAWLDTQKFGYCRAAEEMFQEPVTRFAWSVTRRRVPSRPRVLRITKAQAEPRPHLWEEQERHNTPLGYVSTAACDTTPEVYLDALLEQELSRGLTATAEQTAIVEQLKGDFGKWYAQEETYVSARQLDDWALETMAIHARMRQDAKPGARLYKNPSRCTGPGRSGCEYNSPCLSPGPETMALYSIRKTKHAEI